MTTNARSRKTADERRKDILRIAITEFATYGYHGGSTERIAAQAGISQPYVQRLFGTKKGLFLAALDRVCEDILSAWGRAMPDDVQGATPQERLLALAAPYLDLVGRVMELRLVLQASAAAEDAEIRVRLKDNMDRMFTWVRESTGASYETVQTFWAQGMMLTVAASIGALEDADRAEWARAMLMRPNRT
jgi:AcrR family transcriptional regulator